MSDDLIRRVATDFVCLLADRLTRDFRQPNRLSGGYWAAPFPLEVETASSNIDELLRGLGTAASSS